MSRQTAGSTDPLHKASLQLRHHGVGVQLEVLEGTFSSSGVDAGTRHLLRWLVGDALTDTRRVLDLGCGYGPLGLWLAAADPGRRVLAVDRDARAVESTALGVAVNRLGDQVDVRGGLGYDDLDAGGAVGTPFDLVVSNIPAKIGGAGLAHLLLDAWWHVGTAGRVATVVVDRLVAEVTDLLTDDAVEVLALHPSKGYTAFVHRFHGQPAAAVAGNGFERGVYRRGRQSFEAATVAWEAEVSWSVPDFDSLGHGTAAALALLPKLLGAHDLAIAGVGQGHLALAARRQRSGQLLRLVDRDLLALRTAAANLADPGVPTIHAGRLLGEHLAGAGAAVIELPEREPVAVVAAVLGPALAGLGDGGRVLLHGRASDLSRVTELVRRHGARLQELERARQGSHGAVLARISVTPRR